MSFQSPWQHTNTSEEEKQGVVRDRVVGVLRERDWSGVMGGSEIQRELFEQREEGERS